MLPFDCKDRAAVVKEVQSYRMLGADVRPVGFEHSIRYARGMHRQLPVPRHVEVVRSVTLSIERTMAKLDSVPVEHSVVCGALRLNRVPLLLQPGGVRQCFQTSALGVSQQHATGQDQAHRDPLPA